MIAVAVLGGVVVWGLIAFGIGVVVGTSIRLADVASRPKTPLADEVEKYLASVAE